MLDQGFPDTLSLASLLEAVSQPEPVTSMSQWITLTFHQELLSLSDIVACVIISAWKARRLKLLFITNYEVIRLLNKTILYIISLSLDPLDITFIKEIT